MHSESPSQPRRCPMTPPLRPPPWCSPTNPNPDPRRTRMLRAMGRVAVLVPVKAFGEAKVRLAPALDAPARAALARRMAEQVLRAACGLPAAVVCDDPEVAAWAGDNGARVIDERGRGLNGAVARG